MEPNNSQAKALHDAIQRKLKAGNAALTCLLFELRVALLFELRVALLFQLRVALLFQLRVALLFQLRVACSLNYVLLAL